MESTKTTERKSYDTPRALEQAIKARARAKARELNVSTEELMREYYFQRLLARVFKETGWLLKGGQALLVRYPLQARLSRDIDVSRPSVKLSEAVEALQNAAMRDEGDYFNFIKTRLDNSTSRKRKGQRSTLMC